MASEPVSGRGVGIAIPVLNEARNLGPLLDAVARELAAEPYTICLVDDGSDDGSRELIAERGRDDPRIVLLTRQKHRPGCLRGSASRLALQWLLDETGHDVFVDLDADGAQRPEELLGGVRALVGGDADVVIASKYVDGSEVLGRSLGRRLVSRFYSALARGLMDSRLRDYSNSYRFYTRAAAAFWLTRRLRYESPVYLLDMLAAWLAAGYRVVEIPTRYVERDAGRSKVTWRDLAVGLLGTLDVAARYRVTRLRYPRG